MSFVPLDQLSALRFNKAATVVPDSPDKAKRTDFTKRYALASAADAGR